MQRQVDVARPAADGLVHRGMMIRHLVMPGNVEGTRAVINWIAANLPEDTRLTLMSQYEPMCEALNHPGISRRITRAEYADAVRCAQEVGLTNLDIQPGPP